VSSESGRDLAAPILSLPEQSVENGRVMHFKVKQHTKRNITIFNVLERRL